MHAPEIVNTSRLYLRRPREEDAEAIFHRYASDPEVTRYMAWPRHVMAEDSRSFIALSDEEWRKDGVGPYLIELHGSPGVIGSTGLSLRNTSVAETGYVLARDVWGQGLATEALHGVIELGRSLRLLEITANVHPDNLASVRVLEKCGFVRSPAAAHLAFPNLGIAGDLPALEYTLSLGIAAP